VDKRLPIALLLSFIVIVGWQFATAKLYPPVPARLAKNAPAKSVPAPQPAAQGQAAVQEQLPTEPALGQRLIEDEERSLELRVGEAGQAGSYYARFSNRGARLLDLRLGNSFDVPHLDAAERADIAHWTRLVESVPQAAGHSGSLGWRARGLSSVLEHEVPLDRALWTMQPLGPEQAPTGVEFKLQPGAGVLFTKRVSFQPGSYDLRIELSLTNEAAASVGPATFLFTPAEVVPPESGDQFYIEPEALAAGRSASAAAAGEKPELENKARDDGGGTASGAFALPAGPMSFAGVHNKYFAMLLRGDAQSVPTMQGATWRLVRDEAFAAANPALANKASRFVATDVLLQLQVPPQGETRSWNYTVYAGPKEPKALQAAHADHAALLTHDLGFFASIARFLLWVLNSFHALVGNWGVAIILLTLSVRLVLFPVNRRSQTAMARYQAKMKRVQPLIEALKKRYEKDPQKLRQEQALLMQKEGAFPPLGGCLPMFLQIPVFFGLFSALRAAYDLRQAPFVGWMNDMAKPDRLVEINFNTHLPFIGTIQYFNLLPILMVVLWVLQQRMMPKPTDEQAAKMQKIMMIMPIFMGFFLYSYAAGLSLYMITQSGMGIIEMVVIKKFWPLDATEQPRKEGGFWSRLAKLQEEQQRKLGKQQPQRGKDKRR